MSGRVAFVVQRCGLEVNGGAELLCRMVAERLARHLPVEVLTTCALDYMTWENHYPPGEERVGELRIRRFPVERRGNGDRDCVGAQAQRLREWGWRTRPITGRSISRRR